LDNGNIIPQKSQERINYLDAARGIAALMVLFYHFLGWKYHDRLLIKLGCIIFNGSDAVSFFFVLSGFVLAYPYLQLGKSLDIGKFYINRVFRIYPAFLVALLINTWYALQNDLAQNTLRTLYRIFIVNDFKFWEEALLLKGKPNFLVLDWTLTIEITMSFLMPFLIVIAMRGKRLIVWLTLSTFLFSYITGHFFIHFALGLLACAYYQDIRSESFKRSKWYRYRLGILAVAIVLFSLRHIDRISPFGPTYNYLAELFQLDLFTYSAIASFVFMVYMIVSRKMQKLLQNRILLFLGKISYGIYLMHWIFVWSIFDNWDVLAQYFPNYKTAFAALLIVCLLATIISAWILYYAIELPFIKLGKRITKKMAPTITINPEQK